MMNLLQSHGIIFVKVPRKTTSLVLATLLALAALVALNFNLGPLMTVELFEGNETPSIPTMPLPRRHGIPNQTLPLRDHPHAGGMDEYDQYGYVHEPTVLRYSPHVWPFVVSSEDEAQLCAPLGDGPEKAILGPPGTGGYSSVVELTRQIFGEKIRVTPSPSRSQNTPNTSADVKVFCAIYTQRSNNDQTDAIRETWGRRCDGFLAASTETIHEAAAVKIPHDGPNLFRYEGTWQRVRSILGYFYDNFLDEYDFIFLCGDDTFVIMENLKSLLTSPKFVEQAGGPMYPNPVYAGLWMHPFWLGEYDDHFVYMGGGGGYVLSRSSVTLLVETILPVCQNQTFKAMEDVYVAECLKGHNITGYDTRDDEEAGRFFMWDIGLEAKVTTLDIPGLSESEQSVATQIQLQKNYWQERHNFTPKHGIDSISSSAISFHYVKPAIKMRRYERMIYRMQDENLDQLDCGRYYARNTSVILPSNETK